ncbi:helix-turn-helix domain-containing protein, partial [Gilvimarinus sp. 1_MG-2023]
GAVAGNPASAIECTVAEVPLSEASLDEQVRALEIRLIGQALLQCSGNRTRAARQLGISRQGLIKKIERYGL